MRFPQVYTSSNAKAATNHETLVAGCFKILGCSWTCMDSLLNFTVFKMFEPYDIDIDYYHKLAVPEKALLPYY